jgi:small subunit ribosomal protein S20
VANSPQAIKRARQNNKRRANNAGQKTAVRTKIKNTLKAIAAGEKDLAYNAYKAMVPAVDSIAGKGMIKKRNAARIVSRINKRLKDAFNEKK